MGRTQNEQRCFLMLTSRLRSLVAAVAPDVVAPAWPCSPEELSGEEMEVLQLEPGDGASFQPWQGPDGCDDWMCGEVQAIWLLAIRSALNVSRRL